MTVAAAQGILSPQNRRLLAGVCVAQCALVALPGLGSIHYVWLGSASLLIAGLMLFSARRTLLVLAAAAMVLPAPLIEKVRLPLGLRLEEVLIAVAVAFIVVDILYRRGLSVKHNSIHFPVLAFLGASVLSAAVGIYFGNDGSIIQRNLRFPLYYAVVFVVVQAADRDWALRYMAPLFAVAGFAVSIEYILEFLGALDLSTGDRFFRVVRRQGIVLPMGLLFIANLLIHDPRRFNRPALAGMFLTTGLAFALTVGRGLWVAFAAGLLVTMLLRYVGQPAATRRAWRSALLAVGVVVSLVVTVLVFQRFTGAAITAHAVERSRTFVDYRRDVQVVSRLLGYAQALEAIAEHPIAGSGQGKTLTFYSFNPDTNRFETWTAWTLDSLYLTLWLKMGVAGLLAFGWLCAHVLRRGWRAFTEDPDPRARAALGGAIAVIVANLVLGVSDASMLNGRFAVIFGLIFGLVAVIPIAEGSQHTAGRALTREH